MILRFLAVLALLPGLALAQPKADKTKELTPEQRAHLQAAERSLAQKTTAEPKNVQAWKELSMVRRRLGDDAGGQSALERAAALAPDDPGISFMIGLLHEERGQKAQALAAFRRCLAGAAPDKLRALCEKHLLLVEKLP